MKFFKHLTNYNKTSQCDPQMRKVTYWPVALILAAAVLWLLAPLPFPGHGFRASFYPNPSWQGEPRLVELVRYPEISADGNLHTSRQVDYSVRYQSNLSLAASGDYAFLLDSDDGSELYLDEKRVIDNSGRHPRRRMERTIYLAAGVHQLRLDYFQGVVDSQLRLRWKPPGQKGWSRIPLELLTPGPPAEHDHLSCLRYAGWRVALLCLSGLLAAAGLGWLMWNFRQRLSQWLSIAWLRQQALFWDGLVVVTCLTVYLPEVLQRYDYEPYLIGDSPFYANVTASLLYEGNLDQHSETVAEDYLEARVGLNFGMHSSSISLGARGEWYPKHALLLPVVALPFYAWWGGRGLLIYNLLQCLLLAVAMRRLAAMLCTPGVSLVVALLVALSPLFVNYTYSFSADVLGALLITAGTAALLGGREMTAGVLLGLACWAKTPNILAPVAAGLLLMVEWERKKFFRFLAGAGTLVLLLAAMNWYMFGAPWLTGYSRVLVLEGGRLTIDDHLRAFSRPLWEGVLWQLGDQRFGLIHTAVFPALGLVGLYPLWKKRKGATLLVGFFFLTTFLFYSVYDYLHGSHWGNRFLIPPLSLLALPLGCLVESLVIFSSAGQKK